MPDLGSRLRDHYDSVVALLDPEDIIEGRITHDVPRPGTPSRMTGRPGWAVALVAAALVLVAVGGMVLLVRPGADTPPVATSPPPTTATPVTNTTPPVGLDGLPDLEVGSVPTPFTGTLLDVAYEVPLDLTGESPITAEQLATTSVVEQGTWSLQDQRGRPVLVRYTYENPAKPHDNVIMRVDPWDDAGLAVLAEERAADMAFVVVLRKSPDPWTLMAIRAGGYEGAVIADPFKPVRGSDPHLWGMSPHAGVGTQVWVLLDEDGRVVDRFCGCDAHDPPTTAQLLEQLIATID